MWAVWGIIFLFLLSCWPPGTRKIFDDVQQFQTVTRDRENLRFWIRTVTLHGSTLFYLQSSLLAADFTFVVLRFYFVYLKWVRSKNKIINSFISPNIPSLIFSSWDSLCFMEFKLIFCLIFLSHILHILKTIKKQQKKKSIYVQIPSSN